MDAALLLLALFGHAFLWVAAVNRLHATGLPRRVVNWLTALCFFCLPAVPLGLAWWFLQGGPGALDRFRGTELLRPGPLAVMIYLTACWLGAALALPRWIRRHLLHRPPAVLRFYHSRRLAVGRATPLESEEHPHHFLVRMPGNQSLRLDLTERVLEVPRLAPALAGLSLVHLSDFHFTGHVGKPYFQEVVRRSNELQPDLVAITGDLVDRSRCIDWIPDTLGGLRGRYGVYFILGNHDRKVDSRRLLRVLDECGLVHLGGRWLQLEIRGAPVLLAGNELPWFRPAEGGKPLPPPAPDGPLRIVLAHTPDQLDWARGEGADLMLAGHTHGGQVRLPLVGPIFTPARSGVRYASGVFHAPPTIMHVTRGVSGQLPLRLNCPPEMVHLTFHAARPG